MIAAHLTIEQTDFATMILKRPCELCGTRKRAIRCRELCGKCYYWQRKLEKCEARLDYLEKHPEDCQLGSVTGLVSKIAKCQRVINELKWREDCLRKKTLDAKSLESLICAVARDCRSEMCTYAANILRDIPARSRRLIFEVLLSIVENLPSRLPSLHELNYPTAGSYYQHGWLDWQKEFANSTVFSEAVS